MRRESVILFGCHYPTNLNSLGHCICVHQGKMSAAAGFEPGINHATMSYPGAIYISIIYLVHIRVSLVLIKTPK